MTTNGLLPLFRKACLHVMGGNLAGCCVEVSCIVQGIHGGDILEGHVRGERHYWNRLPDGSEVDLTSCQFGGDGFTPMATGQVVERLTLPPIDSLLLASEVLAYLITDQQHERQT